jgi:glucokinase
MSPGPATALLGDIGATYARFALMRHGRIGPIATLNVADFSTPVDAIHAVLATEGADHGIRHAAIAAAGPVTDQRIAMTNAPWVVDAREIRDALGLASTVVLNDFEALAWSLPVLAASDVRSIGGGARLAGATCAVIGPGTGFGAAGLVQSDDQELVIVTEAGHATLAGETERHAAIIRHLKRRLDHVSIERALSGGGLRALCDAVGAIDGVVPPIGAAPEILQLALQGGCPTSRAALELFCELLGGVAGDLALTLGARGGLYIAGGLVPRFVDFLEQSNFRRHFEAKGRMSAYLKTIPTAIIMHPHPAFPGLARVAAREAPSGNAG